MSTGTGPTHSFVYPVRTLLTGNILPATTPPSPSDKSLHDSGVLQSPLGASDRGRTDNRDSPPHSKSQDIQDGLLLMDRRTSRRRRRRNMEGTGRVSSPNFRHFPGDDGPTRSFVTAPVLVSTKIAVSRP